jgi:hypothetical protein
MSLCLLPTLSAHRHPSSVIRARLTRFLEEQTGKSFGDDLNRWRQWMWRLPYDPHPQYATFKGRVYAQLDPRFADFFREPLRTSIRLDEVDWAVSPSMASRRSSTRVTSVPRMLAI